MCRLVLYTLFVILSIKYCSPFSPQLDNLQLQLHEHSFWALIVVK